MLIEVIHHSSQLPPHFSHQKPTSSTIYSTSAQTSWVHAASKGAQREQDALQQYWPFPQTAVPHCSPSIGRISSGGTSSSQICCVHAMSGFVHKLPIYELARISSRTVWPFPHLQLELILPIEGGPSRQPELASGNHGPCRAPASGFGLPGWRITWGVDKEKWQPIMIGHDP